MHWKGKRPSSIRARLLRSSARHQSHRSLEGSQYATSSLPAPFASFLTSSLPLCLVFYERFAGRAALLDYAAEKGIPVFQTAAKPWSTDENLFHISYEAGILEDPDTTPPHDMWKLTQALENTPKQPERITITFTKGIPTTLLIHPAGTDAKPSTEGKTITDSVEVFLALNALARNHGIGRCDIVENRFIGVKSRGCYESPAATILRKAHMDLEGLTMDRNVRALRDNFLTVELSKILYNGYWFVRSPSFSLIRLG